MNDPLTSSLATVNTNALYELTPCTARQVSAVSADHTVLEHAEKPALPFVDFE
jgi:hypothetical protein